MRWLLLVAATATTTRAFRAPPRHQLCAPLFKKCQHSLIDRPWARESRRKWTSLIWRSSDIGSTKQIILSVKYLTRFVKRTLTIISFHLSEILGPRMLYECGPRNLPQLLSRHLPAWHRSRCLLRFYGTPSISLLQVIQNLSQQPSHHPKHWPK